MQLLTLLLTMVRARQLAREFRSIERYIRALPVRSRKRLGTLTLREIGQASCCDFPHLYGTAPDSRYLPWGQGTDAGYERANSHNSEVALRGMALWLAVAYHETKHSTHPWLRPQHRQLTRIVRELKEIQTSNSMVNGWMQGDQAAA